MEINGKVAVVTGAGGNGSGRAIACRFARDGAAVVVSDIDEAGGIETVRLIESRGGRAAFLRTDVRVEEQVRNLIDFAVETFGGLGIVVNNASAPFRPGEPLEHWADTVKTDLFGTMYGTRFAIDAMRRTGGGAIVNLSSISALWHGRSTPGGSPAFDVAKSGVIRLTTTLAWLGEKENIRVNCLAPGYIASDDVRSYWESLTPGQRIERGAPSRLLEVEEVAQAVVRLATDESLCGRVLVWWSDDSPGLIPWGDPGYSGDLELLQNEARKFPE
jgi:NAD(P)-dependent dehydrogenase (short-subunit alcohol dehydrogenase family)